MKMKKIKCKGCWVELHPDWVELYGRICIECRGWI